MRKELRNAYPDKKVRIMFQDEAGFGRINKPKYCRCNKNIRPSVPCHNIREYSYAYGAIRHKSKGLKTPDNIRIIHIPPYTPEMNPIEQIRKQIRSMGFKFDAIPAFF